MPIQINELVIKTEVSNHSGAGNTPAIASSGTHSGSIASQDEIAAIVLEILKEKKER